MPEKHWYIKNCRLFERLTPSQIQLLERVSTLRHFPKNSSIYLPADRGDGALLLTSGRVKIGHLTEDGKEAVLAYIEPGELFGELSLIEDASREESAEAILPSLVVFIPAQALQNLMAQSPYLSLGISRLIGFRRKRIERRLKSLLFRSNRHRLVHLLLELIEQYGKPTTNGTLLGIRLSHQDLANVIGSTRETVTMLLGTLQSEGLLTISRQKIIVRHPQKLAEEIHTTFNLPQTVEPQTPQLRYSTVRVSGTE
ncbi:MAG: Crp/Fnr family transcriptional regulator [Planctomycetaceae bacterium]